MMSTATNTIEELGGNAVVVPGRGFLLNNELTDFNFVPLQPGVPVLCTARPGKGASPGSNCADWTWCPVYAAPPDAVAPLVSRYRDR